MSTNYYFVKKAKVSDRNNLIKLLRNCKYYDIKELSEKLYEENCIHIGNNSFGWKFQFNSHEGKIYDLNRKSINSFISQKHGHIEDEYGRVLSPKEFWKIVDESMGGLDNETYYGENNMPIENTYQFYSDGLLFSTLKNFE